MPTEPTGPPSPPRNEPLERGCTSEPPAELETPPPVGLTPLLFGKTCNEMFHVYGPDDLICQCGEEEW